MNAYKLVEEKITYYICDLCLGDHKSLIKAQNCCKELLSKEIEVPRMTERKKPPPKRVYPNHKVVFGRNSFQSERY